MASEEQNVSKEPAWKAAMNDYSMAMSSERDKYIEQIVKKQSTAGGVMFKGVSYIITAFGVYALFSSTLIGTAFLLLGAGMIWISSLLSSVEYEYLFVNNDCEISKIYNKSSRRKIVSFEGGSVERVVPYTNERFQNDLQVKRDWVVRNLTSTNKENKDDWYGIVYKEKERQVVVLLELNEKSADYIKKTFRNKIQK